MSAERGILIRNSWEIPQHALREVRIWRGVLDRIVGIGSVGFSTSAGPGLEVKFLGVADPGDLRDLLREHTPGA